MSSKLSVLITCKNEANNLRGCAASVRSITDELLVADSGSTDETLEIAAELGARIIEREYRTAGDFKNWAIPQARHRWVLLLDADERATPEMCAEIRGLLASGPRYDGYWVYRANHFLGHPVRYGAWANDRVLRLFDRDQGRYVGSTDHAEVAIASGRVSRLQARLTHHTMWSIADWERKLSRYATVQAQQHHAAGRLPSYSRLLLQLPLRFIRDFVLKGGFLDGAIGLQLAWMCAYHSFQKQAYLWAEHHGRSQPLDQSQKPEPDAEPALNPPVAERAA